MHSFLKETVKYSGVAFLAKKLEDIGQRNCQQLIDVGATRKQEETVQVHTNSHAGKNYWQYKSSVVDDRQSVM